jgi:hypothetical protein
VLSGTPPAPAASPPLRLVASRPGFENVYRNDYLRMVRVAAMLLGSTEGAEDVVQDAYVALYHHFDTVADPPGYLYRSVVNGCGSHFRHRKVVARFRHLTTTPTTTPDCVDVTWTALRALAPRRRAVIVPTILPIGVSPDGNPWIEYPVVENWDPILTYHQEGTTAVVDLWVNLGPGGVQHLDHIEIPPRPNQNRLILGSTSTPLYDVLAGQDPLRVIGGVVTTSAANLFMTRVPPREGASPDEGFPISGIEAFPGLDLVMLLVPGDLARLEARDADGNIRHVVTPADPDAFPDFC